jgi:hypothetical protein
MAMGYTTDFLGHIEITPSLNEHEAAYLSAFRHSRHWDRPGGPYDVAANPFAEDGRGVDRDAYNSLGQGKPQLYCQWEVCWDGCLDGLIVGNRRDTREMFAICVDDSNVHQKTLVPGMDSYRGLPRLPYERAIDEWPDDLAEIRRSGRGPRAAG